MKKSFSLVLIPLLLLTGCLQSKEHLTINKDGSGTLAVETVVPEGTRQLIDTMMGGLVQGMAQAMQGMAQGMAQGMGGEVPKMEPVEIGSVSDEMFGNKEEILKKAKTVGLEVKFLNFEKKQIGKDLHVAYTLQFDDVNALARSGIVGSKFALSKGAAGNIVFTLKRDEKRAAENKTKAKQFMGQQDAPGGGQCPLAKDAKKMEELMDGFSAELFVTMPNPIQEMTPGIFTKRDDATAGFAISGNFLKEPGIMNKMYFIDSEEPSIVCSGEGVTFEPAGEEAPAPKAAAAAPPAAAPSAAAPSAVEGAAAPAWFQTIKDAAATGKTVRILLKGGSKIEGTIGEHDDESFKVECAALAVTIFAEEIQDVEEILE